MIGTIMDVGGSTSLMTGTTTLDSTTGSMNDEAYTSVALGLSTTVSVSPIYAHAENNAAKYLDSLSDAQIVELSEKIDTLNDNFVAYDTISEDKGPKQLTKSK